MSAPRVTRVTRPSSGPGGPSPAAVFDELHRRHAASLVRQAFLLCGRRWLAERAVTRAFHLAWERWPEVAAAPDQLVWVRTAAYEYALSPWRRAVRGGSRAWARAAAERHPGPPQDRALVEALLSLPPCYRRTLVLHDAVGLDLAATAAELEASEGATAGRLAGAREALAGWVPRLAETPPAWRGPVLRELLRGLATAQPASRRAQTSAAIRAASERATRRVTWLNAAWVALMAAVITLVAVFG